MLAMDPIDPFVDQDPMANDEMFADLRGVRHDPNGWHSCGGDANEFEVAEREMEELGQKFTEDEESRSQTETQEPGTLDGGAEQSGEGAINGGAEQWQSRATHVGLKAERIILGNNSLKYGLNWMT